MKKILCLILAVILVLSLVGCGEQKQSENDDELEEIVYTIETQSSTIEESSDSAADNEIASKSDIANYLKTQNMEVSILSDSISCYDSNDDVHIGFYFDGLAVDDGQKMRIKVTDGMFGNSVPSNEDNAINIMLSMLKTANVQEEISMSQIKNGMQLTDSLFAMKTYEYKYSDELFFILEKCLDNQGKNVISYNLFCDIF